MKKILGILCVVAIIAVIVLFIIKVAIPYNNWWIGVIGNFFDIESTFVKWIVAGIIDLAVTIGLITIIITIVKHR